MSESADMKRMFHCEPYSQNISVGACRGHKEASEEPEAKRSGRYASCRECWIPKKIENGEIEARSFDEHLDGYKPVPPEPRKATAGELPIRSSVQQMNRNNRKLKIMNEPAKPPDILMDIAENSTRGKILAFMKGKHPVSLSELIEHTGSSTPTVSGALSILKQQGLVTNPQRGYWAISDRPGQITKQLQRTDPGGPNDPISNVIQAEAECSKQALVNHLKNNGDTTALVLLDRMGARLSELNQHKAIKD